MRGDVFRHGPGVQGCRMIRDGEHVPAVPSGGLLWGALGVVLFSMSLPATRVAVGGFDPLFVASGRAAVAGLLALAVLVAQRAALPARRDWGLLLVVAGGTVVGWPVLTSVAMAQAGAVHGAVLTGTLPAATAVAAVLMARERPSLAFWLAAATGLACVLAFAGLQGAGRLDPADALLLLAVMVCAAGYAAGGVLARRMGGLKVIGWALVLCLPLSVPMLALHWNADQVAMAGGAARLGFAYVAIVSQYLGFFAWYRGLAQGGVARVGQLQLAQPVLSMLWAVLLLGESVSLGAAAAAAAVLGCVVLTQRAR